VRCLPSGQFQARYAKRSLGTFANAEDAILARKLAEGDRRAGRPVRRRGTTDPTLDVAAGLYLQHRDRACRAGDIRTSTLGQEEKDARPWLAGTEWSARDEDGFPIPDYRVSQLTPGMIALRHDERRTVAPEAARKELFRLKAILRHVALAGASYEPGILALSPGARSSRKGIALRLPELELFANAFPERMRSLPLFCGTVGLRIGEALSLTRDRVDLGAGTVFVPAELCKEDRDKTIPLTAEEVELLRAQLALVTTSAHVWPRPRGGAYDHWSFWGKVWDPARQLAAAATTVAGAGRQPFGDLRPHDLRHTAATLMRRAGFDAELAALRLGHADAGWLLMTLYNHPDPDDLREQMRAVVGAGIRAAAVVPAFPLSPGGNVLPLPPRPTGSAPVRNSRRAAARPRKVARVA